MKFENFSQLDLPLETTALLKRARGEPGAWTRETPHPHPTWKKYQQTGCSQHKSIRKKATHTHSDTHTRTRTHTHTHTRARAHTHGLALSAQEKKPSAHTHAHTRTHTESGLVAPGLRRSRSRYGVCCHVYKNGQRFPKNHRGQRTGKSCQGRPHTALLSHPTNLLGKYQQLH